MGRSVTEAIGREVELTAAALGELARLGPRPCRRREAVLVSVVIAAFGNGVVIAGRITGQPEWVTLIGNPAGALAAVVWMRRRGWTASGLGLRWPRRHGGPRAPLVFTAAALVWAAGWLVAGVAGVAGLAGLAGPAGARPLSGLRLARLAAGTVLAEEVLHRGVVPAVWAGAGGETRTVVLAGMATFGAWHVAGATRNGTFHPFEVIAPAVGAVVFLWARMRTGSVLAPAAAHLAGNVTGLGAVAS